MFVNIFFTEVVRIFDVHKINKMSLSKQVDVTDRTSNTKGEKNYENDRQIIASKGCVCNKFSQHMRLIGNK